MFVIFRLVKKLCKLVIKEFKRFRICNVKIMIVIIVMGSFVFFVVVDVCVVLNM